MWKRRAEIAILALLVVVAGGTARRPHVHVSAPSVDLAGFTPDRITSVADVGRVTISAAILLLD